MRKQQVLMTCRQDEVRLTVHIPCRGLIYRILDLSMDVQVWTVINPGRNKSGLCIVLGTAKTMLIRTVLTMMNGTRTTSAGIYARGYRGLWLVL